MKNKYVVECNYHNNYVVSWLMLTGVLHDKISKVREKKEIAKLNWIKSTNMNLFIVLLK